MDLDKKNKELMAKNEELRKEIREKTMSGNEGLEEQVKRMRKDQDFFRNKFEKEVSHLDRVRKERNRAEDKLDVVKKEVSTLIETTKEIKGDLKGKDAEIAKLTLENKNLKDSQVISEGSKKREDTDEEKVVREEKSTKKDTEEEVAVDKSIKAPVSPKVDEELIFVEEDNVGNGGGIGPKKDVSVSGPKKDVSVSGLKKDVSVSGLKNDVSVSGPRKDVSVSGPKEEASVSGHRKEVSVSTDKVNGGDANGFEGGSSPIISRKDREVSKKDVKAKEDLYADYNIEDCPTDEEWETISRKNVGNFIVYNHTNAKESRSRTVSLPKRVIAAAKRFTMTSMGNRAMFIVLNSRSVSKHNPKNGTSFCGLSPACSIKWKEGDPIAMVFLFDVPENPLNETEIWVCKHHSDACIEGVNLQTQKACKFKKNDAGEEKDPFKDLNKLKKAMNSKK